LEEIGYENTEIALSSKLIRIKMQNQAAVEALYSATFVEDYLDCIENLPNELQRNFSTLREYDLRQKSEFLSNLDNLIECFEKDQTPAAQRLTLLKIQQGLIAAQDIGDDKLATVQIIADIIENKTRQLEQDSKNLDFGRDDDDDEQENEEKASQSSTSNNTSTPANKSNNSSGNANGSSSSLPSVSGSNIVSNSNKPIKSKVSQNDDKTSVKRRKKQEKVAKDDKDDALSASGPSTPVAAQKSGGSNTSSNNSKIKGTGKKQGAKNRKSGAKKSSVASAVVTDKDKDDSDREEIDPSTFEIDPDEPTYCLCDQVSYGEMVGCDNDLCPIEWFHFNCVQLTNKPKGRWYCPKCRGDKSTVMKPKAQFLKELEKYNKEREEKMSKQAT